jgi:cytochrome c
LRKSLKRLTLAAALLSLGACGSESENASAVVDNTPQLSAATLGEQTVLSVADYLAQEKFKVADARNGHRQVQICRACHSLEEGGPNMIGPGLFGFFGRVAGEPAGFDYSPVLQDASFVWTPRALDAWLAQPGQFLPGNRMIFAGIFRQKDRDDLIAYLLRATSGNNTE